MHTNIDTFCTSLTSSLEEVIRQMCANRWGIILVVDQKQHLAGTVTDGDIRRAILAKISLQSPVQELLERKKGTQYASPVTALIGQEPHVYFSLLKKHQVLHLPLLDEKQKVVALVTMSEFAQDISPMQAVVMAGGRGTRLYPLTEDLPKPMLPIGDRPLLEIIIEQLRSAGVKHVNITTHHKPEKIIDHFGDGKNHGVELSYVSEDRPLGTAGALGFLKNPQETLLVMNGDLLTQVDFGAMLQFHREHVADLTVGVRAYAMEVPYGVVECEGSFVSTIEEKPNVQFLVNAGIYLLEPVAHSHIPVGEHFNMTDLIQALLKEKRRVVSFPIHESWIDVGEHAEYRRAQEEVKKMKGSHGE